MSTQPEEQARAFMTKLLTAMCRAGGSDLFISANFPPTMKTNGKMQPLAPQKLSPAMARQFAQSLMNQRQRDEFAKDLECNFAISIPEVARFRVNVFVQQQCTGMVIRTIPAEIPSFATLALPEILKDIVMTKRGLVLVVGATGSGKSTSLAAMIDHRNRSHSGHIITVEDPVEYILAGINQVQVNETVGLTFAAALRSILRQAPNIVMIGEIRDLETATIAINASLTGHLVFSTLHTNDAPSAVTRLMDIGVKPFLVASSTRCLMAQRLVRKICKTCAQPYQPTDAEMHALSLTADQLQSATLQKGRGCNDCGNTGYRSRFGIFEIFVIDDETRKLIYDKATASVLRARAREMGMRTLREDGIRKVLAGLTTAEEVIRSTLGDEA